MSNIIPTRQGAKADWMSNLATVVGVNSDDYFVEKSQAAALTAAVNAFVSAMNVINNPSTKTRTTVAAKNTAEAAAMAISKVMIGAIRPNGQISDQMKVAAGIPPINGRSPVPPVTVRPAVDIVSVTGRQVTVSIHDSASSVKRGKPAGAIAAYVYAFVGTTYPSDPSMWAFNGAATKSKYDVNFPESVANGAQVWVCAAWVNRRGETGPVSVPISTNVQGGGVNASANMNIQSVKIAA